MSRNVSKQGVINEYTNKQSIIDRRWLGDFNPAWSFFQMSRTSAENETDIDKVKLKWEELQKLELCAVATITSLKKK